MDIFDISSLEKMSIPTEGMSCRVKGRFFFQIAGSEGRRCYLSENANSSLTIQLNEDVGEFVVGNDETFGMLVGGEFAYFDLDCVADGVLCRSENGQLSLRPVDCISLRKDELCQSFELSRTATPTSV